jgi:hypothetical protein
MYSNEGLTDIDRADAPLTPDKCIRITYNEATTKFSFECGPSFDAISVVLAPNLARLMGFTYEETRFTVISDKFWNKNPTPPVYKASFVNDLRTDVVDFGWFNGRQVFLREFSTYPVSLSLGVNQVFVESNLVNPAVYVNGRYRAVLAVVKIDVTAENYQSYTPDSEEVEQQLRTDSLGHATFKLVDAFGDPIKLLGMSEDSVRLFLRLKRKW